MTTSFSSLRGPRLTVRGWLGVVLGAMGAMVLLGAMTGGLLLNRADDVSHELDDSLWPAQLAAGKLQVALRDQETGVRGYLISGDRQFLAPYDEGKQAERSAAEEIRRRVGRRPHLIADLDAIETSGARWRQTYAEPVIAHVTPTTLKQVSAPTAEAGKAQFDHLRQLFDAQNASLSAAATEGSDNLKRIDSWRDRVLVALVLVFFVTAGLLGMLVRRAVSRPLATLAAACRRITEGHFGDSISPPQRPRDIRDIAIDVENMRQRIVAELDATRSARALLDEQTVELRRSNTELEQFAYVASHDLQEPLRKVASFCQLLEKRYGDQLDERGIQYIAFAVDGAKRMQVLINDLLSFSRVGRLGTARTEVELDTALDSAIANLSAAVEESGAVIVRNRRLPHVMGDPTLLTMLWQNLIGNAVKFRHPDRAPRVVIDCEEGAGDHVGQWLFSVADNGIGIPAEFSDKVFVIFQRLHGRDLYAGTGVGLALCKKIIEHHGGHVWLDSSYADGARLEFTLPIAHDAIASIDFDGQRSTTLEGAHE